MHHLSTAFARIITVAAFLLCSTLCSNITKGQAAKDEPLMTDTEINSKIAGIGRMYKLDSAALLSFDKIITYEREVFVGKIYNITFTEVRFTCPPDNRLNSLMKSQISQILYSNGRRDVFIPLEGRSVKQKELVDTSRIIIKTQKDWMKVMVTEDPEEVENLTLMADLKARYEADMGNAGKEELMKQASIILRKKAAMIKAHYVLIETKFFTNSYGDLPKIEVTAKAFGY